jgi:nucleoside-diphosphate-sugar epimerase
MSCLGRERVFDYYSQARGQRVLQFRLNYAVELRYGVLVDVARKVYHGQPLDVTTGYANVLWQGDVCDRALRCLPLAASPPRILNVTGPQMLSIRQVARTFGELFGKEVTFTGRENGLGYLSNAAQAHALFGPPTVPVDRVIQWTARWIQAGGADLGKPTHFETQDGRY